MVTRTVTTWKHGNVTIEWQEEVRRVFLRWRLRHYRRATPVDALLVGELEDVQEITDDLARRQSFR